MLLPRPAPASTAYSSLQYTSRSPSKEPTLIMAVATSSVSSQYDHNGLVFGFCVGAGVQILSGKRTLLLVAAIYCYLSW